MASVTLSRRVEKVVPYPPLAEMSGPQRRDFQEALLDADSFEDLPGKWQAAILKAGENRLRLRIVDTGSGGPAPAVRGLPIPLRAGFPQARDPGLESAR